MNIKTILLILSAIFYSCSQKNKEDTALFEVMPSQKSGITFKNQLEESSEYNILNYLYFYNGGGVAIGDINGDGLADIYFSSNMNENKLYLNKGDFQFEDITDKAGVESDKGWKTGVAMADVNGDGLLDIYVCKVGSFFSEKGRNELFINNGDNTFSEKAAEWGVDFQGFSTQAAFFDYDKDGDLDMYLLNHSVHSKGTYGPIEFRNKKTNDTGDRFFRNDGGAFVDVTSASGIYSSVLSYGLAVAVADLNNDGWQDVYISNDFHENDYLYYNNQDGTFTEALESSVGHTSRFSMGNDAADINNDGWTDLIVADMQSEDEVVLKSSEGAEPYEIYQFKLSYGYSHQYARNTLQINSGIQIPLGEGKITGTKFSEIGQLAGIHATDWSWATLFCDFDNDGSKDLFVSNGIKKRPNNLDYLKYISGNLVQASLKTGIAEQYFSIIDKMPDGNVANYIFKNVGNYQFTNMTQDWGLNFPTISNGAAYGDLDNDGDYDLVINNLNDYPALLKNSAEKIGNKYLKVVLEGENKNTFGIGAKIEVRTKGRSLFYEQSLTRGFQSSVEPTITIGLGLAEQIDSLIVTWNSGKRTVLKNIVSNSTITVKEREAVEQEISVKNSSYAPIFEEVNDYYFPVFCHKENNFNDFNREILLPKKLSTEGPKIAVGDVNGDGQEDYFVCGASGQPGGIFIQGKRGFENIYSAALTQDSAYEDVDAVFFDADNDNDLDLYVVSGGYQFEGWSDLLADRLYINTGNDYKGVPQFAKSTSFPQILQNGSCVAASDFDKDGDLDLFVGARGDAGNYGTSKTSYILLNNGNGTFKMAPEKVAPNLKNLGMVTDGLWMDVDKDGYDDLIICGEWMPITILKNDRGILKNHTDVAGFKMTGGFWNCVYAEDIDSDGDEDIIAGNLGLNSIIKASELFPASLLVHDFDQNGRTEAVFSYFKDGRNYPFNNKDELSAQMVYLKKEYPSYHSFAGKSVEEIFSDEVRKGAAEKKAYTLSTALFINDGRGKFKQKDLPVEVQFAPVYSILAEDIDKDGYKDLLLGGNFYGVGPAQGRYDASVGLFLKGTSEGKFVPVHYKRSGLMIEGQIRDFKKIKTLGEDLILVGRNNETIHALKVRSPLNND